MAENNRKNGARNAVMERALNLGLKQVSSAAREVEAELKLNDSQERMVSDLCTLLGLSARSVLNAALRYALYQARCRKLPASKLREFPRRLDGRIVPFQLTAETLAQVRDAEMIDQLAECALAGIKLLHQRLLRVKAKK